MDFMELAHYEFCTALQKSPFEKWAEHVEKILGHDLDGNQETDGYSLDFALDCFNGGMLPRVYASQVLKARVRLLS